MVPTGSGPHEGRSSRGKNVEVSSCWNRSVRSRREFGPSRVLQHRVCGRHEHGRSLGISSFRRPTCLRRQKDRGASTPHVRPLRTDGELDHSRRTRTCRPSGPSRTRGPHGPAGTCWSPRTEGRHRASRTNWPHRPCRSARSSRDRLPKHDHHHGSVLLDRVELLHRPDHLGLVQLPCSLHVVDSLLPHRLHTVTAQGVYLY